MKPLTLIILDGWGYNEHDQHNAIKTAKTPNWDQLWQQHPHTLLTGSGLAVGLPDDQMGNSEVGHLTIGAGRTVYQELTRIDEEISNGNFFRNSVLVNAVHKAKQNNSALHLFGLLSPGGVHSHENHLFALATLAQQQGVSKIYFHVFLDGRDTPPKSALDSITKLEKHLQQLGAGKIVSMIGRYYAMDRDKRWERIQHAYELLTEGKADYHATSAEQALRDAYERDESDEFVKATSIHASDQTAITINNNDVVVFMNFRADRARQLTRAFIETDFNGFIRHRIPQLAEFVSLTQYAADIKTTIAYPPQTLQNTLGEYAAQLGLKQLRLAETEKYAHVTFFFNGGIETIFPGEDRVLIPSPKVATYDLKPEMSAYEVTEKLEQAIASEKYDLIICNFANPDMLGHTGNFAATQQAIHVLDECLGKIITALQAVGGEAVITADHGNAECMFDEQTQQAHTAHTCEPVPFLYIGRPAQVQMDHGTLADIAPTLLHIMGLPIPKEMTGRLLVKLN